MSEPPSHHPSKVEIFISARNLKTSENLRRSDPFCVIFLQSTQEEYIEIGRTSKVKKNQNPNWPDSFLVDYFFEIQQNLRFEVFNYHKKHPENIGIGVATLGELVWKGNSVLPLSDGGSIVVGVQEVKENNDSFLISLKGIGLDKKDTFGKSDPYLILYKSLPDNQWVEIYKTEVIPKTLDPIWKPFELTEHDLCNFEKNPNIRIECFDYDKVGSHELIGISETNFENFIRRGSRFDLFYAKKNRTSGIIEVSDVVLKKSLSFIDYLRVGVHFSVSVAFDFSYEKDYISHGFFQVNSLVGNTEYQRAFNKIAEVLKDYDTDNKFPVYGFAGHPNTKLKADQCFALTNNESNPYVEGIEGVNKLFQASVFNISPAAEVHYHSVIDRIVLMAKSRPPHEMYHVLLIVTYGKVTDMPETISSIVEASYLPISIIILGVGGNDFSLLEKLDSDKKSLKDALGRKAARDIVQFVPYRKFYSDKSVLAAEALKELPKQMSNFYKNIGYAPPVPVESDLRNYHVEESKSNVRLDEHHHE